MAKKTTVTLSLDVEADKDILRWLDRQENRSSAIRAAIREHLGRDGVTLGDVYQAVKEIERRLRAGAIAGTVRGEARETWEEPPDAAAALDALGRL
jgi:Arc/MetJ-type ribon-helix-helix transcriptional regulator